LRIQGGPPSAPCPHRPTQIRWKLTPSSATDDMVHGNGSAGDHSEPAGSVYVANNDAKSICEYTTYGRLQTITTNDKIREVTGIAFHDPDLYVTWSDKREIYKLTPP
jgi:hypothetical protein